MILLAVALLFCSATVLCLAWLVRPYADRLVALAELRAHPPEPKPVPTLEPPPNDLIAMALSESDGWAREDALAALWELHEDCGSDWNATRNAYFTMAQGKVVSDSDSTT